MNLSFEALAARRQYFLGATPNAQLAAAIDALVELPPEQRGVHAALRGDDLEINVLDVIGFDFWTGGGVTAKAFKRILDEHPNAKRIRVVINSPGGFCDEGIAIYNALKRHKARVTTEVLGLAASAASVVFMAGDAREMNVGTQLMVHRAWICACGHGDDLRAAGAMLDGYDESIVAIYAEHNAAGKDKEAIRTLVHAETYMTAEGAQAEGFATKVLSTVSKPENPETPEETAPEEPSAPDARATRELPAAEPSAVNRHPALFARAMGPTMKEVIQ